MQEETEMQKSIWTPPRATHIDMKRTLIFTASFALGGDLAQNLASRMGFP